MTMYRMQQREMILRVLESGRAASAGVLLDLAGRHVETVFAAHTHTQPAQVSTVAHYLLAVVEQLERDAVRLRGRLRVDESQSAGRMRHHRDGVPDRSPTHD